MLAQLAAGRYSPANPTEADLILRPRLARSTPLPPVVFCHGSTQAPSALLGTAGPGIATTISRIVELGRMVFTADGGPNLTQWANATAMSRLTDLVAWARTVSGYSGPVHLIGASMGHATACRWAAQHPTDVLSITGIIPVTGIQWCRDNNATLRAQIDAAWGVTYPAALPAGADPFTDPTMKATLAGIPWQGFAANDDVAAAPLANAQAWAAQVGGTATDVGALGHTDAAMGAVPFPDVIRLLYQHE